MDLRFHCIQSLKREAKKSKHGVANECEHLKQVLKSNPDHGVVIPKRGGLRKMRVHLKSHNFGQSGGYRLIYKCEEIDETLYVVLLATYFKGKIDDLSNDK